MVDGLERRHPCCVDATIISAYCLVPLDREQVRIAPACRAKGDCQCTVAGAKRCRAEVPCVRVMKGRDSRVNQLGFSFSPAESTFFTPWTRSAVATACLCSLSPGTVPVSVAIPFWVLTEMSTPCSSVFERSSV